MSRTISQIYDAIIAEKETFSSLDTLVPNPDTAQTFLTNLTSSSKVAIWRLWAWVFAVAIWSHEKIFDEHVAEIEALSLTIVAGTKPWYVRQSLLFQYGDALIWDSSLLKYAYAVGSTGIKVVFRASVIEVANQLRIKIAKDSGGGVLAPLSGPEETAFTSYINTIKFAGTNISVTNINADTLKLIILINYDPLILTSDGEIILTPGTFPVEDAINDYIKNLPFDGTFNKNRLIDAMQAVEGVIDPEVNTCEARTGANPFVATGPNYVADAGYLVIDPSFPLNANITYNAII